MSTDQSNLHQHDPASQAEKVDGTEPEHEPGADLFTDPDLHDPDRMFDPDKGGVEQCKKQR